MEGGTERVEEGGVDGCGITYLSFTTIIGDTCFGKLGKNSWATANTSEYSLVEGVGVCAVSVMGMGE